MNVGHDFILVLKMFSFDCSNYDQIVWFPNIVTFNGHKFFSRLVALRSSKIYFLFDLIWNLQGLDTIYKRGSDTVKAPFICVK